MIVCRVAPHWSKVTENTAFRGSLVANVGLDCRSEFPYRVYVLKCAGPRANSAYYYYVGITAKENVAERLKNHFSTEHASTFTDAHRPLGIEFLHPAAVPATEALVYFAMVQQLGLDAVLCGRLGGWAQTFLTLDETAKANAQREYRMLQGSCTVCGKKNCRAELHDVSQKRPPPETTVPLPPPKRPCVQTVVMPSSSDHVRSQAQVLEPPPSYARVCVLGREYTTLKWFLGRKTNDAQLARAVQYGFTRAIQMSGGDSKTLQVREMVSSTAARPPELLPSRQNLLSDWVETICPSLRTKGRDFLWVRRVAKPSHFRHLLLPCDELVQCFQQKGGEFTKHFSRACIPNREKGAPTL